MKYGEDFLGKIFVEKGFITPEQLKNALSIQEKTGERLGDILLNLGYVTETDIAKVLAEQQKIPFVEIEPKSLDKSISKIIPLNFCEKYNLVPVGEGNSSITVAVVDPLNLIALDDIRMITSKDVKVVVSTKSLISRAIDALYRGGFGQEKKGERKIEVSDSGNTTLLDVMKADGEELSEDDAPVIQLVSRIIMEAYKRKASDIHVEPLKNRVRVRYRIDGALVEVPGPPKTLQGAVTSRLKIMSRLDIAEKRLPQDGRIKIKIEGNDIDIRVSTLPAIYGESIVLRLLDRSRLLLDFSDLGFLPDDEKKFRSLIDIPNGIILVTGPTGSGKTTTLYTSLNSINKPNRKIITVEDPVEYQLRGINQVQVRPEIGLTFAAGLRSILRQAPNVIMVGEIRDIETANIAVESSLTGHLVFSTLHTNDAAGAVTRLIDMGVKSYLVASALRAVLAQRLIRKICPLCKEEVSPDKDLLEFLGISPEEASKIRFFKGIGCRDCNGTGYSGRIALFELLIINDEIGELIYNKESSSVIKERARHFGMKTLREDGMLKVMDGITTIEEIVRVTQTDSD